jgi:hypothetical protein
MVLFRLLASTFFSRGGISVPAGGIGGVLYCRGNIPRVPRAAGYGPKTLDTIGSLQWQMAGEPYTPYQGTTPPL